MKHRTRLIRRLCGLRWAPGTRTEWLAAVGAASLAVLLVKGPLTAAARAAAAWWWLPAILVPAVAVARWYWALRTARARAARLAHLRYSLAELDAMDPYRFELAVRDLMIRDGIDARHVGQRGDQAADAIGREMTTGNIVVAQCKHTTVGGKVGSPVMYQIKGTAGPAHKAHHAFVVTNGTLTADARRWGQQHQVGWIDRDRLQGWADRGQRLQQILRWPRKNSSLFNRCRPPRPTTPLSP